MRVSVLENFRTGGGSVPIFSQQKIGRSVRISATGQCGASFQQTCTNLCSTSGDAKAGQPCRAPAVRGWRVCRMHGARGGAPEGKRDGKYTPGARTKKKIKHCKTI